MKLLSGLSRFGVVRYLMLGMVVSLLACGLLAACGEATKPATPAPAATTAAASTPTTAAPIASATNRGTASAPTIAPAATTVAAASGNIEAGKKIFVEQCGGCHGAAGGGGYGPKVAATKLSYEEVLAQVRNPKNKGQNIMTPFSPVEISDAQVRDIYAFLQSLR